MLSIVTRAPRIAHRNDHVLDYFDAARVGQGLLRSFRFHPVRTILTARRSLIRLRGMVDYGSKAKMVVLYEQDRDDYDRTPGRGR